MQMAFLTPGTVQMQYLFDVINLLHCTNFVSATKLMECTGLAPKSINPQTIKYRQLLKMNEKWHGHGVRIRSLTRGLCFIDYLTSKNIHTKNEAHYVFKYQTC